MAEHSPHAEQRKSLAREVAEATGQTAFKCYQCGKCSAGCPMAGQGDILAHQVFRLLQLNDPAVFRVLQPWLCVSCQTCMTRCPQGLDLSKVMDYLRSEAIRRGTVPASAREIATFNAVFMDRVAAKGRLNEAELGGHYNLRTVNPFNNLTKVPGLLARGKIRVGGKSVKGVKEAIDRARRSGRHS
jgi:heterodisulfide reductase subunit C